MAGMDNWFLTRKVFDDIYLTTEHQFFEGNRSNIWLIKGPAKDVIIDTGLGVCNLKVHLQDLGLLDGAGGRSCEVICTHVHFDHSGGAHHFDTVYIHEEDYSGLKNGRQTETLNYVKHNHFYKEPYQGFSACGYKVPSTDCMPIKHGEHIDLGSGHHLEIIHVPGHTKGSIAIYYPQARALFSGDFVYECGAGTELLDWLPTSCVRDYVQSAGTMVDWLSEHEVHKIYPGHFAISSAGRISQILQEYIEAKDNCCGVGCTSCLQGITWAYFFMGCFRCCPC